MVHSTMVILSGRNYSASPQREEIKKMAKHRGKKYLEIAKLIETGKLYEVKEALELVLKTKTAKFTETVEVALRLGVDPRHADQQVRGTVVLPHGTVKTVKVLAITSGANVEKSLES